MWDFAPKTAKFSILSLHLPLRDNFYKFLQDWDPLQHAKFHSCRCLWSQIVKIWKFGIVLPQELHLLSDSYEIWLVLVSEP